jgi:hypothetical protein
MPARNILSEQGVSAIDQSVRIGPVYEAHRPSGPAFKDPGVPAVLAAKGLVIALPNRGS